MDVISNIYVFLSMGWISELIHEIVLKFNPSLKRKCDLLLLIVKYLSDGVSTNFENENINHRCRVWLSWYI